MDFRFQNLKNSIPNSNRSSNTCSSAQNCDSKRNVRFWKKYFQFQYFQNFILNLNSFSNLWKLKIVNFKGTSGLKGNTSGFKILFNCKSVLKNLQKRESGDLKSTSAFTTGKLLNLTDDIHLRYRVLKIGFRLQNVNSTEK